MDQETELKSLKDGVFLNVGKNVVLFQQIEVLLKALVKNSRIEAVAADFAALRQERLEQADKRSMGTVAGHFSRNVLPESVPDAGETEAVDDSLIRLAVSFRIEGDENFRQERIAALQAVVDQRNELVHEFLPKWDWESVESMRSAVLYLLAQRKSAEAQFEFLRSVHANHQHALSLAAEFLESAEAERQFELCWLQQSTIVNLLRDAAIRFARPDGWLAIARAGEIVNQHAKEDLVSLRERYGFRTLPELIAGCGIFESRDEATENGVRAVFRLKPEQQLKVS